MKLAKWWKRAGRLIRSESGYSLVEVLVAILILSIAIIPMVGMFDAGLRAAVLGGNYDKGRALANEKLEEIKALPYNSPDPEPASNTDNSVVEIYGDPAGTRSCVGPLESGFACKVQSAYASLGAAEITPDASARTMMQVTVTVTWGSSSYSTTGLVSRG